MRALRPDSEHGRGPRHGKAERTSMPLDLMRVGYSRMPTPPSRTDVIFLPPLLRDLPFPPRLFHVSFTGGQEIRWNLVGRCHDQTRKSSRHRGGGEGKQSTKLR